MPEEFKEVYREYQSGKISRREFMQKAIVITGSLGAANGLISGLAADGAGAAQSVSDDSTILTHNVEYQGKAGPVAAYLVRPTKAGKYPAIVVIHENQGLTDHIRDIARRLAQAGFVVLAPDFLSRQSGTMKANPKGVGLSNIRELAPWQTVAEDVESGYAYLAVCG